jgi:hypothetical protein
MPNSTREPSRIAATRSHGPAMRVSAGVAAPAASCAHARATSLGEHHGRSVGIRNQHAFVGDPAGPGHLERMVVALLRADSRPPRGRATIGRIALAVHLFGIAGWNTVCGRICLLGPTPTERPRSCPSSFVVSCTRRSATACRRSHFPGGSGVTRGFDGFVRTSSGTPFVPAGPSVWDLSVRKDAVNKADEDIVEWLPAGPQTILSRSIADTNP